MSAHASQVFSIAHCTDSKDLPNPGTRFCSYNIRPASCINGCHGDEDILQEFTNYFELVGQPHSVDADLDILKRLKNCCLTVLLHPALSPHS